MSHIPRKRRRTRAKRYQLVAKVILHKNERYVMGEGLNISRSGIFVLAARDVFRLNELVRINIRPLGTQTTYKVIARVVRFNGQGYGLEFCAPPPRLRAPAA